MWHSYHVSYIHKLFRFVLAQFLVRCGHGNNNHVSFNLKSVGSLSNDNGNAKDNTFLKTAFIISLWTLQYLLLCWSVQCMCRSKNLLRLKMQWRHSTPREEKKHLPFWSFLSTLLFCRRWVRNVPRFKVHVLNHISLNVSFQDVELVGMFFVVCFSSLMFSVVICWHGLSIFLFCCFLFLFFFSKPSEFSHCQVATVSL